MQKLVDWIERDDLCPILIGRKRFQLEQLIPSRSSLSAFCNSFQEFWRKDEQRDFATAIKILNIRNGCRDFVTGLPTASLMSLNENIDNHHVFPKKWCVKKRICPSQFESIFNRSPLSKSATVLMGGLAPSEYLKEIESVNHISSEALDDIIRSHMIEPKFLRNDDFEGFFADRQKKLVKIVRQSMS